MSGQTLISNGCGASVGLEAGYTQIGSGAASLIGQFLNLRRNDLRLIVGCGAAAAIAAAFGAPITGAFYACELIVGVYAVGSAAPILAASLAGALTAQYLGGAPYSLEVSHVGSVGLEQYLALIGLALIVSIIGILVMRSSSLFERVFAQKWLPVWIRPVIGGLCVGGLAIVTPQVLAAGHGAMVLDLHRDMAIGFIATVIALKLIGLPGLARLGLPRRSVLLPRCSSAACSASSLRRCSLLIGPRHHRRSHGQHADGHGDARRRHRRRPADHVVPGAGDDAQRRRHRRGAGRLHRHQHLRALHVRPFLLDLAPASARRDHPQRQRRRLAAQSHRRADDAHRRRQGAVDHDDRRLPARIRAGLAARRSSSSTTPTIIAGWCCCRICSPASSTPSPTRSRWSSCAKYTDIVLMPEMNIKTAMKMFDDAEAEVLAVLEFGRQPQGDRLPERDPSPAAAMSRRSTRPPAACSARCRELARLRAVHRTVFDLTGVEHLRSIADYVAGRRSARSGTMRVRLFRFIVPMVLFAACPPARSRSPDARWARTPSAAGGRKTGHSSPDRPQDLPRPARPLRPPSFARVVPRPAGAALQVPPGFQDRAVRGRPERAAHDPGRAERRYFVAETAPGGSACSAPPTAQTSPPANENLPAGSTARSASRSFPAATIRNGSMSRTPIASFAFPIIPAT